MPRLWCCSLLLINSGFFQERLKRGSFLGQGSHQALGNSGYHTQLSVVHVKDNFSLEFVTI